MRRPPPCILLLTTKLSKLAILHIFCRSIFMWSLSCIWRNFFSALQPASKLSYSFDPLCVQFLFYFPGFYFTYTYGATLCCTPCPQRGRMRNMHCLFVSLCSFIHTAAWYLRLLFLPGPLIHNLKQFRIDIEFADTQIRSSFRAVAYSTKPTQPWVI